MSPNANFYFDAQQDKRTLQELYAYEPVIDTLSATQQALILGAQGNLWCEWIPSRERMQYMIMPRMQVLSEICWVEPSAKDWNRFVKGMVAQFPRVDKMNVNYRIPDLEGFYETNAFIGEGAVNISCLAPDIEIHYTTDGSIPTLESPVYKEPIRITETTDFTFRTFRPNGKKGDIVKTKYVKSQYAPASEETPEHTGLQAVWHEFTGNRCADIEQAPVNGTYTLTDVTIPAEAKGNIGLIISGYLNVPVDGIYTFSLLSDDGSTLSIDGEMVVDNDGPHAPRELAGQKALAKGLHALEVRYFDQNGGTLRLQVLDSNGKALPVESGIYAY